MPHDQHLNRSAPRRRRLSLPIAVSLAVHAILLLGLLLWYIPDRDVGSRAGENVTTVSEEPSSANAVSQVGPPANVSDEEVDRALGSAIEQASAAGDERKLAELDSQIRKLDRIASEESLRDIAEKITAASGLPERATHPMSPPGEGPFDFDTAQFHDVTRTVGHDGTWRYRSVLVDAQGRSMEVDLEPEQGKTAYEAMQMVKQSPFAETIYRTMVMPMLDKLVPRGNMSPQTQLPSEESGAAGRD